RGRLAWSSNGTKAETAKQTRASRLRRSREWRRTPRVKKQVRRQVAFRGGRADSGTSDWKSQARPFSSGRTPFSCGESGGGPSPRKGGKVLSSAAGTQPTPVAADGIRGGGVCSAPRAERDESFFELAGIEDKQKRPSGRNRRAFCSANSKRSVFRGALRSRRLGGHFRFPAAQPPHGVCAHAPEDLELRGLGFLRLAVPALLLRADELSVNEDMIALPGRVRDGVAEAVEGHDPVPLVWLPLLKVVRKRRRDRLDG